MYLILTVFGTFTKKWNLSHLRFLTKNERVRVDVNFISQ